VGHTFLAYFVDRRTIDYQAALLNNYTVSMTNKHKQNNFHQYSHCHCPRSHCSIGSLWCWRR